MVELDVMVCEDEVSLERGDLDGNDSSEHMDVDVNGDHDLGFALPVSAAPFKAMDCPGAPAIRRSEQIEGNFTRDGRIVFNQKLIDSLSSLLVCELEEILGR